MMFKRIFISTVVNFYDNLVSRKDVGSKTNRGELGLNSLLKDTKDIYSPKDDKSKIENVFEDFEKNYKVGIYFSSIRKIRNQACAHLATDKSIQEIDALLNTVNLNELKEKYDICLDVLNYLVNNIFLLSFLRLPPRNVLVSAMFETMKDQVDFYGRPVQNECSNVESMTPEKAWHIVRKGEKGYEEANEYIKNCLFCHNDDVFVEMLSFIFRRLGIPNLDQKEISMICKFLINAKRGYPERLQDALLSNFNAIRKENRTLLTFVISHIAVQDNDGKILGFIKYLNSKCCYILSTFSALTAMRISVCHSAKKENPEIVQVLKDAIDSISQPTEHLALVLALCSRWFKDVEYTIYHKSTPVFSKYILGEVHKSIEYYCSYIKADDEFSKKLHSLADVHRFSQLQYDCGEKEKARNQKANIFWNMTAYNCICINIADEHEALCAAMLYERIGNIQYARYLLKSISKRFPLNNEVQDTYKEFCKCHPIE